MSAELPKVIELLVSDVDGTLVHSDKTVGAATVAAVQRLRGAGIKFSIVSSRPPQGMKYPARTLGVDVPFAAFNGGCIINPDGSLAQANYVDPDAAAEAVETLLREKIETWVYTADEWLVLDGDGEYVPRERRTILAEPMVVKSFDAYLDRVGKIVAASSDHAKLAQIESMIARMVDGRARAVRSQLYYLDMTSLQATKGHAVTALAERMGVPIEHVAVIGDAPNDLPMFERAALAIAMGQAEEAVKQRAAFVVASNNDDGVAEAIDRYILPQVKPTQD